MNIEGTLVKHRSCHKCGYSAGTTETACPQCGRTLHSSTMTRIRGLVMMLCGGFLIAMIGYISLWMINAISNETSGSTRFTGTQQQKLMIFGLFGTLILFGFGSAVTGLGQLITGRRNKILAWSVAVFGLLIFVGAIVFIWLFE